MTNADYPEGWNEVRGALQRGFRFADFHEAVAFVNRLAEAAEAANHHPDIHVSWNAVTVRWWTHTQRAITERDRELAAQTNELARPATG
ncbi:MAG: 4a-hydroxytetrahydrobiopterin dehydratase [Gaiellaceae bacterium]